MFQCNLMLYTPCINLQYAYKPTGCTKIHVIRLYFPLDALHVSDCISPSSGVTFYKLYIAFGICRYMLVPYVSAYTGIYQIYKPTGLCILLVYIRNVSMHVHHLQRVLSRYLAKIRKIKIVESQQARMYNIYKNTKLKISKNERRHLP